MWKEETDSKIFALISAHERAQQAHNPTHSHGVIGNHQVLGSEGCVFSNSVTPDKSIMPQWKTPHSRIFWADKIGLEVFVVFYLFVCSWVFFFDDKAQ